MRRGATRLRSEIESWAPPNNDLDYAIAKAARLRDEQELVLLLEEARRAHDLRRIVEWPLLRDMAERSPRTTALLPTARWPARKTTPGVTNPTAPAPLTTELDGAYRQG
jgi:hypothetical protein